MPVGAGLIIGRRVKSHYTLNGFFVGLIATIVGLVTLYILLFYTPIGATLEQRLLAQGQPAQLANPTAQYAQLSGFVAFALLIFCTFGASMSGRTEERNRAVREEVAARGGQLERAPVVREASDIRGHVGCRSSAVMSIIYGRSRVSSSRITASLIKTKHSIYGWSAKANPGICA